jgi:hypothetical protein
MLQWTQPHPPVTRSRTGLYYLRRPTTPKGWGYFWMDDVHLLCAAALLCRWLALLYLGLGQAGTQLGELTHKRFGCSSAKRGEELLGRVDLIEP